MVLGIEFRLNRTGWVVDSGGCWIWNGAKNASGYGMIPNDPGLGRNSLLVHRVAYELWVGKIPDGLIILHSCDNPPCINPDHLSIGTKADNALDMAFKGRMTTRKLTPEQVLEIFDSINSAQSTVNLTAKRFNVSPATISRIASGEQWAWLTRERGKNGQ